MDIFVTQFTQYMNVSVLCLMRLLTITLACSELLQFDDLSTLQPYLPNEGLDFMTQVAAQAPRSFPAGVPGVCADPTIALKTVFFPEGILGLLRLF